MTHTPGATPLDGSTTRFVVWAPEKRLVQLHLLEPDRTLDLEPGPGGYHTTTTSCAVGTRYRYILEDGREYADPASRCQPEGVHGPSQVVDLKAHVWRDATYRPRPLWDQVFYELHVGTFSSEGTFDAVAAALDDLCALGVGAIEIMPVAQFPGRRNWGYDGVFPFAVQESYGGYAGLQRLVDACHERNLAVALDVVYNHLGPEGNVLAEFGPYFTDRYRTPWGAAVNFDGPGSDDVRAYFIQNAFQWYREFHIDALRLDAVHEIIDRNAITFLSELAHRTERARRRTRLALSPHSRERRQRPTHRHRMGGRWFRPRRAVERRFPPRPSHGLDRRGLRLLRRLRQCRRPGSGDGRRLRLPRRVLTLPPPSIRRTVNEP